MDITRIEERVGVRAPSERLWDLIADLGDWGRWNPYETDVSGQLSVGGSLSLTESLPDMGQRQVIAQLGDWQPYGKLIWFERRGFMFGATRYFTVEQLAENSSIMTHGVILSGIRGEMFYDKHRRRIRSAYEEIARGFKRVAEE